MRRLLGPALAACALMFWPGASAHAQFSYGYDSLVYSVRPSMTYYSAPGYARIYTDPTLGARMQETTLLPQVVAPYAQPPYTMFPANDGLSQAYYYQAPAAVAVPAARPVVVPMRTRGGLFRRR